MTMAEVRLKQLLTLQEDNVAEVEDEAEMTVMTGIQSRFRSKTIRFDVIY